MSVSNEKLKKKIVVKDKKRIIFLEISNDTPDFPDRLLSIKYIFCLMSPKTSLKYKRFMQPTHKCTRMAGIQTDLHKDKS